jgi:hypothetical protein
LLRFRVNEPNVVYEAFDEEIVAVNLDTGNYYSLSGTGPNIWVGLAEGLSIDEIVRRLEVRHAAAPDLLAAAVKAFAERLVAEQLLVETADAPLPAPGEPVAPPEGRTPFAAPVIENYTDMRDLLMLDPIHDVDAAGWPVAKPVP